MRWVKGCESPNAGGRPRGTSHWQRPSDRIQYWLHKPIAEVVALYGDHDRMATLSTMDALIITRMASAMRPEGGMAMEWLLNRAYGKPSVETEAKVLSHAPEISQWQNETAMTEANALLAMLSQSLCEC